MTRNTSFRQPRETIFVEIFLNWSWLDKLRKEDTVGPLVDVINRYAKSDRSWKQKS